jgi:flavin-dependent dehydrogenase
MVARSEFDDFLLQRAREAGATFSGGCSFAGLRMSGDLLEVDATGGPIRACHVIGADGVFSRVRLAVFGPKSVRYVPSVEALIPTDPDSLASLEGRVVFDFGGMPHGYGWIFPKRDHLNVGVYSVYRCENIKGMLTRFLERYRLVMKVGRLRFYGHAIPVANVARRFRRGNVWLVGDAAGFAEAFFGEGIYYAVRSARLVAEAVAQSLAREPGDTYADPLRREILPDLESSLHLARIFFAAPRFGFRWIVRKETTNALFEGLITGAYGHREVLRRMITGFPFWLMARKTLPECPPV